MSKTKQKSECYVVTSGSYSDYHIEGVYLSKNLAKQHVERSRKSDCARIETWPVRFAAPVPMSKLTLVFRKHGDLYDEKPHYDPEFKYDEMCWEDEVDDVEFESHDVLFRAEGFNHKKVRKVMGDRVAQWKAMKEGIS